MYIIIIFFEKDIKISRVIIMFYERPESNLNVRKERHRQSGGILLVKKKKQRTSDYQKTLD